MKPSFKILLTLTLMLTSMAGADDGWQTLFDGKSLAGWKANAYPDSWLVVEGVLRAKATKESSHLFFVGDRAGGSETFRNFEFEIEARSEPNSNSGIFIHTDMVTNGPALRLSKGYEIQLNSSAKEKRKTGSLYAVVDLDSSPVDESQWFKVRVTVLGQRITIHVNDKQVVDYTEPPAVVRPKEREGRKLHPQGGAIALQAHDPGSCFYFRNIRIKRLP